jgi:hypothetical protein
VLILCCCWFGIAAGGSAAGLLAGQAGLAAAAWEAFMYRCGWGDYKLGFTCCPVVLLVVVVLLGCWLVRLA